MRPVSRPDPSTLWAGISVLALGVLLLLEDAGAIEFRPGWLLLVLGALSGGAIALNLAGGRDLPRVAATLSWVGFALALALAVGLVVLWASGALDEAGDTVLAAVVVAVALGLISAPIWIGLLRRLSVERSARIRADERSELAAHLHDSVLQTLALLQGRADDPAEVARLARRQERELRSWLAGTEPPQPGERLADALRAAAEEVEEQHRAQVEVVIVGDAPLSEPLEALVGASREALNNAAKFAAGSGPIRLYAEIEHGEARVFVDDRGPGFDPDAVPQDRRGVRESIAGRMSRHGGSAEIRSKPGAGTEVELTMGAAR